MCLDKREIRLYALINRWSFEGWGKDRKCVRCWNQESIRCKRVGQLWFIWGHCTSNLIHINGDLIYIGVYLLDGFPRSQKNIDSWNKKMRDVCNTEFVLFFDCDIEKMQERMIERFKISGRSDDNPETIIICLETFAKTTKPILIKIKNRIRLLGSMQMETSTVNSVSCKMSMRLE